MNIRELLRKNIKNFKAYSSARDEYSGKEGIFIDANENSLGSASNTVFNRYPDPHQRDLKQRIAEIKEVKADQVFLGNGSDEIIDLLYRAFCEPARDKVILMSPTYGMYSVCANLNDVPVLDVPLTADFQIDIENVKKELPSAKLIFICSPNNPSTNLMNEHDVQTILKTFNGLVVIDEAYQDFAGNESWVNRLASYKNLVVMQTFSKAWGMAGLRVGMAFADPEIISVLSAIKYPYNISELVQNTVLKALEYNSAKNKMAEEILKQREWLLRELRQLAIIKKIFPTDANFVLIRVDDAGYMYNQLIKHKIIVRDRSSLPGCEGCLRITVGNAAENRILIETLKKLKTK